MNTRSLTLWISAAAAALVCARALSAQENELVVKQQIRTSRLAAVVVDSTGATIPGVRISLFKCPTGEFRGSTNFVPVTEVLTDRQGRFSFPWPGKRVCIQAQTLGMNLLQIEVLHDPKAGELEVKLVPGN